MSCGDSKSFSSPVRSCRVAGRGLSCGYTRELLAGQGEMGTLLDTKRLILVLCPVPLGRVMTLLINPSSSAAAVGVARYGRAFGGWWYYARSEGAIAVA